ncbi:MAG: molecular chaperone [Thermoplasmata archaeon]
MTEAEHIPEAEDAMVRGAFYGSLARAFGPVEESLVSGQAVEELRSLGSAWPELASSLASLREVAGTEPGDFQALAAERLRLFEKGECPPYEASHRREEDPLKDVLMADVAGFYRAFGLEPRDDLPDHLVSELEFMALLCLKEAHARLRDNQEALEVVLSAQEKFLADHLGRWLEGFREALLRQSRLDVYPLLVDLLVDFVRAEMRHLGIPAEETASERGERRGS